MIARRIVTALLLGVLATPPPTAPSLAANAIKAAGGSVDWINLPEIGIKGNSHMMMQDKNSDQIAEVIQKWLVAKGLAE